jgi:hypothetical protein
VGPNTLLCLNLSTATQTLKTFQDTNPALPLLLPLAWG